MNKVTKLYKALKEGLIDLNGSHDIHTPYSLVNETLSNIPLKGNILVMFNIEFVISLVYNYNVDPDRITFYSDHINKTRMAEHLGVNKYITTLGTNMKFDVIIGNPPYNKNLITKEQSVYNHPAMNSEKEGYIGFFIEALGLLSSNGRLIFVTPGKYMIGAGTKNFREWISNNYNLVDIKFKDTAVFKDVSLDSVVITTIINNAYQNSTSITDVNGNTVTMDFTKTNSYIIPNFGDPSLFNSYINTKSFVPVRTCESVGEYGASSKKHYSKVKTTTHQNKVVTEIVNGSPVIEYTDLQSGHSSVSKWRVVTNVAFSKDFAIIPPGVELSHTKFGIAFDTKTKAEEFLEWTKTSTWSKLWNGLSGTRHTHVVIRNMPMEQI